MRMPRNWTRSSLTLSLQVFSGSSLKMGCTMSKPLRYSQTPEHKNSSEIATKKGRLPSNLSYKNIPATCKKQQPPQLHPSSLLSDLQQSESQQETRKTICRTVSKGEELSKPEWWGTLQEMLAEEQKLEQLRRKSLQIGAEKKLKTVCLALETLEELQKTEAYYEEKYKMLLEDPIIFQSTTGQKFVKIIEQHLKRVVIKKYKLIQHINASEAMAALHLEHLRPGARMRINEATRGMESNSLAPIPEETEEELELYNSQ